MNDEPHYWADFEETGEAKVRANLEGGIYNGARKRAARAWLAKVDQERAELAEERDADFNRQQIAVARDAAVSAQDAADSARDTAKSTAEAARAASEANRISQKANKIAIAAILTALVCAAISIAATKHVWQSLF